jgi:hypothetical protein
LIETNEQLGEGFAWAADEHGQAIIFVGSGGDTPNGTKHPDGDFAVGNQFREVVEGRRDYCGVLRNDIFV